MSILTKILHPIKSIEQWALKRLIEGFLKNIPASKKRIIEIWEQHKYEIFQKVKKAMQKAISDFFKKKMEEQGNPIYVESDN